MEDRLLLKKVATLKQSNYLSLLNNSSIIMNVLFRFSLPLVWDLIIPKGTSADWADCSPMTSSILVMQICFVIIVNFIFILKYKYQNSCIRSWKSIFCSKDDTSAVYDLIYNNRPQMCGYPSTSTVVQTLSKQCTERHNLRW